MKGLIQSAYCFTVKYYYGPKEYLRLVFADNKTNTYEVTEENLDTLIEKYQNIDDCAKIYLALRQLDNQQGLYYNEYPYYN